MVTVRRTLICLVLLLTCASVAWVLVRRHEPIPAAAHLELEQFRRGSDSERMDAMFSFSEQDPEAAWNFLKKAAFDDEGRTLFNTHNLAHLAGNGFFHKYGLAGIRYCDDSFTFGCRHGVSAAALMAYGPDETAKIADECGTDTAGCVHGIGHGLAGWESYDIPAALSYCDRLPQERAPFCYDGVYMETFQNGPHVTRADTDAWNACAMTEERYIDRCARYIAFIFEIWSPGDYVTVASLCEEGPTETSRENCARSLGYRASWWSLGSREDITAFCATLPREKSRNFCIMGAARETAIQPYENAKETASALCSTLPQPEAEQCAELLQADPYHP